MSTTRELLEAVMNQPIGARPPVGIPRKGPQGHILPPGTGPAGETCKTCHHIFRNELAKTYLKCGLNRANWTGGGKTDIRAGDAACAKWEQRRGGA